MTENVYRAAKIVVDEMRSTASVIKVVLSLATSPLIVEPDGDAAERTKEEGYLSFYSLVPRAHE
jgi:hypothetical protein